jgi:hypothetical protein
MKFYQYWETHLGKCLLQGKDKNTWHEQKQASEVPDPFKKIKLIYMKTLHILYFLFCCLGIVYLSCEKADLQKSAKDDTRIKSRIDECKECPEEDCCCGVQLLSGTATNLILCGTSSPDVTTTGCNFSVGSCTVNGFELPISLASIYDKGLFCMPQNAGFSIHSTAGATLRVSCQNDVTSPWYQDVTVSSNGTVYMTNNGSCQVGFCNH